MDWKESKPEFHNRLVLCYKEKIMMKYTESGSSGKLYCFFTSINVLCHLGLFIFVPILQTCVFLSLTFLNIILNK